MNISLPNFTLTNLQEAIFGFFCLLTIAGAGYMLFTKNLIHAAFALLLSFFSIAALFVFAGADFVAVSQLMVYVGGILVLLVFGIMLTQARRGTDAQQKNLLTSSHQNILIGVLLSLALVVGIARLIFDTHLETPAESQLPATTVRQIGLSFLTDNLVVFEVGGILLLVALIGASHLAKNNHLPHE